MIRRSSIALAAAGLMTNLPAVADEDLARLRAEIEQVKQTYEARIAALEARLETTEQSSHQAAVATSPGATDSGHNFNPQISLTLDGVFLGDNRRGRSADAYADIDGIHHTHDHEAHGHGALERGFNLRETELAFSATVSPHFDAAAILAISDQGDVELEEAYFDTRSLPDGLKIRGGKFLSGIGYLNARHPHEWDFVDQNLPYLTLLGEHGLVDTGLRLSWVPRTGSWYTQLGVELFQGKDQTFASTGLDTPEAHDDHAAGTLGSAKSGPRLTTLYAKFGPDLGDRHALQFGGWVALSRQHQEVHAHAEDVHEASDHEHADADEHDEIGHEDLTNALEGKAKAWGIDVVYQYDKGAYGEQGNWKLVAEYLRLNKDLDVAFHEEGDMVGQKRSFTQDGLVLQGAYGFLPHWDAGLRYDVTGLTNTLDGPDGELWDKNHSDRWTFALTRRIDHFSLLRLQVSRANLWVEGEREGVNQLFLQYQHSLGAHGAHSF